MRLTHCIILACVIPLGGCALQNDVRILESRIIALESRNMELQQRTAEAETEKRHLESQLEDYSKTLEEKNQSLRDQSAGLYATADRLQNEIRALNGRIDETEYRLKQNFNKISQTTAERLNRIERHLDIGPMSVVGDSPSQGSRTGTDRPRIASGESHPGKPSAEKRSEADLYQAARDAFEQKKYRAARQTFERFLKEYPNARYADSAHFWIGETYYQEKRYEQAILEYQVIIDNYAQGNKVPDSLLKQGLAFAHLGDKANARLILQEVIDNYPDSGQARIARRKLGEI